MSRLVFAGGVGDTAFVNMSDCKASNERGKEKGLEKVCKSLFGI